MGMPTVRGIIFDFGGVFTRNRPREAILRRCEAELGLSKGELRSLLFAGQHWWDVSTGRISAEEYWRHVREALGGRVPASLEPFKHNPFAYEPLNGRMIALAKRLRQRYTTALLSNATAYLDALLAEHGLSDLFDVVVNSARVGVRKPDQAIFELTLSRLALRPEECLLVDDKKRNTEAAEALGIKAITFRSAADLIRRLKDQGENSAPMRM
jgi:epoxide hydrolase-like predicted phosphatase